VSHNGKAQPNRIRTLLADNTRMGSHLLCEILRQDELIEVIACTADYSEALACAVTQKPDVAVISAELNDDEQKGLQLCQELSQSSPASRNIVLMDTAVADEVAAAFRAGAKGVFFRTDVVTPLFKCIRCVHNGQIWASSRELNVMTEAFARSKKWHANASLSGRLTERERSVVSCVAEGLSNREISKRLNISEHTTKNYIFRIFDKLGVSNRVELILCALSDAADSRDKKGNGLPTDEASLARYYHETVARGVGVLPYRLGEMYRGGIGVSRNNIEAYVWFSLAESECAAIRQAARHELKAVEAEMSSEHLNEAKRRLSDILDRIDGKGSSSRPAALAVGRDRLPIARKAPDSTLNVNSELPLLQACGHED
jgi:DNA-binding NarL/FixJ family response regulator